MHSGFSYFDIRLSALDFLECLCQLIGAGGGLHAAADALHTGDHIVDIHTLNQSGNALQIAVAAPKELDGLNLVILNLKKDALRAGSFGLVFVLHISIPFCY